MVYQKYFLAIGFLALLTAMGCAGTPHKVTEAGKPKVTEELAGGSPTNAAAREVKAHNFVEIEFKEGSATLTESAQSSVIAVIEQARRDGDIDEVIVLSWSDEEYPSKNLSKLPKKQRELAEKRNRAVESYVKKLKSVDVDSYNMAEQPNALSKWFNSTDSRLKGAFVAAGLPTTADSPQYISKASHSVILVKVE
ncbi:MAG: hypothetical protein SGJ18_16415 [Pseudomonadota bacterium]|nr:hypothetical protein [Pseudomonadota bacterium]